MDGIKIEVTGNLAKVTEKPVKITAGTVGLPVEFSFDDQWEGLSKTAVFKAGHESKIVAGLGTSTTVPWEVLSKHNQWLCVGVYGVNEDGSVAIPTIWANVCVICKGANPSGDASTDPALPVWQELLDSVGELPGLTTNAKDNLVNAVNEVHNIALAGGIETDKTLTKEGRAAEAKAVGEAINSHVIDTKNPHGVTIEQIGAMGGFKRLLNSADDMNNIVDDGVYWYSTSSVPQNAPFANAAVVFVFGSTKDNRKVQLGFRYGQDGLGKFRAMQDKTWRKWAEFAGLIEDTTYPGCYYRYCGDVIEWVNPPMIPSVEYRTTERYNGYPVYCMTVNTGALAQGNTEVEHDRGIAKSEFVRVHAYAVHNSENRYYPLPMVSSSGNISATFNLMANKVVITAFTNLSAYTGRVTFYYRKN